MNPPQHRNPVEDQRIESRASSAIDQRFGWKVHVNVHPYNRSG